MKQLMHDGGIRNVLIEEKTTKLLDLDQIADRPRSLLLSFDFFKLNRPGRVHSLGKVIWLT